MKLFKLRTNILLFATLLSFGNFVVWYFSAPKSSQVLYVKASKEVNLNFTDKELAEFIKDGNLYPSNYAASKNIGITYIKTDLYLRIEKNGRITLNREELGSVEDTKPLKQMLDKVFQDRIDTGVFEEGTNKIFKRVFINRPVSVKYGDVVKVIDALKSSSADPIILQIDELPE